MAKYFDPPPGYRLGGETPGLAIQLRKKPEGGELLPSASQIPLRDPYARNEVIVLVHGFNNHFGEAGAAYLGLRDRQYPLAVPKLSPPELEKMIADMFWPGDAAWGFFDWADFMVYPSAVGTAKQAAPILAQYLQSMPATRIVHFLAHSLGCRLVLETIDYLRRFGGPPIGKVCLMAAAVPLSKVLMDGSLAKAMQHANEVCILYSDDDPVLKYTFPPGQTLARDDEGFFPTALGGNRPPPNVAGRIVPIDITDASHGDYWGHSKKKAASEAAKNIAGFFKFGRPQRSIASRSPGSARRDGAAAPRETGSVRAV